WKKLLKVVLFASIALVLLYFSFRGIHWNDFLEGLRSADYFWILMSVLVGAFSFYIRAARWRIILLSLGKPVRRIDTFNGVGMAYLTNFAIPRAGEVARCGVVSQRSGLGFDKV
ncbi:lysylphosphatidylglycerol synthase transmembrane domain-containing protein, partial [Escherichia coli]